MVLVTEKFEKLCDGEVRGDAEGNGEGGNGTMIGFGDAERDVEFPILAKDLTLRITLENEELLREMITGLEGIVLIEDESGTSSVFVEVEVKAISAERTCSINVF